MFLAGTNLRWETHGGRLVQEFRANHNGTITADTDRSPFPSTSRNISEAEKLSYLASYRLDMPAIAVTNTVSGRVEKEFERFTPEGSFADGLERQRGRIAYTGEWRGGFADRLFLTAGIRHDDNDNFQDFTTWRTAASLVLSEINMRPHASVGTAVKLPTMFEQFGTSPFFVPNPGLTPEESFGWDAGVEFTFFKGDGDPRRHLFPRQPDGQDQRHGARANSRHLHLRQPAGREHARGRGGLGSRQARRAT